jgi:lipoprotein-anchoring transpeptidase ErfK/SrfK
MGRFHLGNVRRRELDRCVCATPAAGTASASSALDHQRIDVMQIPMGQHMTTLFPATRRLSPCATVTLVLAGALLLATSSLSAANAQSLGYAPQDPSAFPQGYVQGDAAPQDTQQQDTQQDEDSVLPDRLRRQVVNLDTREAPGTIIIDTGNTYLYYVLGGGRAIRYGVGVGRQGFTWAGVQTISRKAEWPDWYPPAEMIARQPYLPRFVAGGPGNPLGARAMYLGSSEYRIHGTNDPTTIGKFVSSGCIRLTNEDVADLFSRVDVGTKVVVLPKNAPLQARSTTPTRPAFTGREAMNVSSSGVN